MHKIFEAIDQWNKRRELKSLEAFINNIQIKNSLAKEEALQNIKDGIIVLYGINDRNEAYKDKYTMSKGVQITHDGYILTSAHCVDDDWERWAITQEKESKTQKSKMYSIERICITDKVHDLALIKAKIPGKKRPKNYIISDKLYYNMESMEYFLNDTKVPHILIKSEFEKEIQITTDKITFIGTKDRRRFKDDDENIFYHYQQLLFIGKSESGDSGSPILTENSELISILSGGDDQIIAGPHIHYALSMITKYISKEKKK
jgi:hypothetical protein